MINIISNNVSIKSIRHVSQARESITLPQN